MPNPKKSKRNGAMPAEHKLFNAPTIKIIDGDKGIVEELVAVTGNIDHGKDRIMPGAFTKTIKEGVPSLLVLDQHNTDSIFSTLGVCIGLKEITRAELPADIQERFPDASGGLVATTQYMLETPEGAGAFARIKAGAIKQRSIGFDIQDMTFAIVKARKTDTGFIADPDGGVDVRVREIRTIKLMEYSPVLWGMNEATATISAKAGDNGNSADEQDGSDQAEGQPSIEAAEKPNVETDDQHSTESPEFPAEPAPAETAAQKEMTDQGAVRRMGDVLTGNIHQIGTIIIDDWMISGKISRDEQVQLLGAITDGVNAFLSSAPVEVIDRQLPQDFWMMGRAGSDIIVMKNTVPENYEYKVGRAISQANADKLTAALNSAKDAISQLESIVAAAGLNKPAEDASTDDAGAEEKEAQVEPVTPAATQSTAPVVPASAGVGQDQPPTQEKAFNLAQYAAARRAQLQRITISE